MALVCPACGTENRAVAKFCIECIGPLEADFEPTQLLTRRNSSSCTTLMGMPTALADFAAPPPSTAPVPTRPAKGRPAEPRKGLWLSVAAFATVLVVGAGGWLIAGAAGLHLYSAGAAASASADAVPSPMPAPLALSPAPAQSPGPAAMPAATPTSGPTLAPAVDAAIPRVVVAARSPSVPPNPIRRAAAADPAAACAELGFLARSSCLATHCSKAEHRGHSSCQALFAQQRLMEEKRNPVLAN